MTSLSAAQLDTLRAVCDTFIPALPRSDDPHGFWARAGSDMGLERYVLAAVARQPFEQQAAFAQLLTLLESPAGSAGWRGPFHRFSTLALAERTARLERWATSPVPLLRQGFQALKRSACFLFYAACEGDAANPSWEAIGYPGPLSLPPTGPRPIQPLAAPREVLYCDTVVVGSGAGGGVVAGELARGGQDVIVVEKGPYVAEDGFRGREAEGLATLYEAGGTLATQDLGTVVLAGSCLGGGTTVNWAGAFRTSPAVLAEWTRDHALPHLLTPAYGASFDAVEAATHVDCDESPRNPQNQALWDGSQARGTHVAPIPRNVAGCDTKACGFCGFGCPHGAKQGTLRTYLQVAHEAGARFLVDTTVHHVIVEAGRAVGVVATHRDAAGRPHPVTIRARIVVVAAGAIHTPALLRRSGLRHPEIGRNLYLHPTVPVPGVYAQAMDPWLGVMMAAVSDEWAHLDGAYGFKLETPPAHPGLLAMALPWQNGAQHKAHMLRARHLGSFIVLVRDRHGGRVTVDRNGQPVLHYNLHPYDRAHLLRGIAEAARTHLAAGAASVLLPHGTLRRHHARDGAAALEVMLAGMEQWGWGANQFTLFSAHQMGTCRMGGDRARHPLTPEAETREVRGLFVTDASAFPAASGVNPMLSVQALAHFAAQGILAGGG